MVRNDARFHLVMLISEYSHARANAFEALFEHAEKQRSSDRSEMQEINEFFGRELRPFSRIASDIAVNLETSKGVDHWLREFRKKLISYIVDEWRPK